LNLKPIDHPEGQLYFSLTVAVVTCRYMLKGRAVIYVTPCSITATRCGFSRLCCNKRNLQDLSLFQRHLNC